MKILSYRIATIQINNVNEKISNNKIAFLGLNSFVIVEETSRRVEFTSLLYSEDSKCKIEKNHKIPVSSNSITLLMADSISIDFTTKVI